MKQVNFSHPGGFPLEQETLERLQTAYRSELYEAFKSHLGLKTDTNYLIAHATDKSKGWAVIHQDEEDATGVTKLQGILYPINNSSVDDYLRTTRTRTNLIFGAGTSQTAYYDYDAVYINQSDYNNKTIENSEDEKVKIYNFYNLRDFSIVPDIDTLSKTYLPLDGSKAMEGDLDLGEYHLSKLDTLENFYANIRAADLKFGSEERRGILHPDDHLGRALVDSSDETKTNLTLNHASDWQNTTIGGKLYLDNLNTNTTDFTTSASSANSLLLIDDAKQVTKSTNLLNSLLSRITKLETEKSSAIPIGMIAIWGKPAPFPEGWEEYVPLKGRMPVGFDTGEDEFNVLGKASGTKSSAGSVPVPATGYTSSQNTSKGTSGKLVISTGKEELGENLESVAIVSSTPNIYFSLNTLNPYRVVNFIEYTGKPSDKTAPTTPTNLTLLNVTTSTAYFSWAASTDDVGVDKYLIYENGQLFAEVSGTTLFYTTYNLNANTLYRFTVLAKDIAGNVSSPSQTLEVTTADISTIKPENLFIELQNNQIYLNWDLPVDPAVISYDIWRRTPGGTSSSRGTSPRIKPYYYDNGTNNTTYLYKVRSLHASGNYSGFTEEVIITTGTPSCFDIESPVTMATGHSKKLKNVVVGDKLQGFAFPNEIDESDGDYMLWNGLLNEATKTEVTVVAKHTSTQPAYYEIKTVDNTLKVTGEHPLLITQDGENVKWLNVKNISENMLLIDKSGNPKPIESIVFKEEPLEVAVLDVETVDNYIISGIVAHNKEVEPFNPEEPF
ncbi:fibronectin type III domain-containing protein [Flavobacterium sp.]|uniref:fibronectin type III domain-containing protein n=1 Tax=Flavobacterium sp. TaxID=239 RepID=UPI002ED7ECB1